MGRSFFDFLVTVEQDGRKIYKVPFPFTALTNKIQEHLSKDGLGDSPLKQVLIPLGRSLQRNTAAPDFFKYPRIVVAVDTEPAVKDGQAGLLLKDRLFLGYQEKANVIEVISYNQEAGRFEFQVVRDYAHGRIPQVFYAKRTICTACHQNGGPIFSRRPWDETNANPHIAARLQIEGQDFHGVPVNTPGEVPLAIDVSIHEANLYSAYQLLWRESCGDNRDLVQSIRCRASILTSILQYRLSERRNFDTDSRQYRDNFLTVFVKRWRDRWPGGLWLPNPDIPNRDPLPANATGSAHLDPLNERPSYGTWSVSRDDDLHRVIAGLAEFMTEVDVRKLDQHVFNTGLHSDSPRKLYWRACEFTGTKKQVLVYRLGFKCGDPAANDSEGLAMTGWIDTKDGDAVTGTITWLKIDDAELFHNLKVASSRLERHDDQWLMHLRVLDKDRGLHVRQADGSALEHLTLRGRGAWPVSDYSPPKSALQPWYGDAVLTVMDDFSLVDAAIDEMVGRSLSGKLDVFSSKPFRRKYIMRALFSQLGMTPIEWCCNDDGSMPPVRVDGGQETDPSPLSADEGMGGLQTFYRYCASCHRTSDRFPPNFLSGNQEQVASNLAQCAQRIYFRLQMWRLRPGERSISAMPPISALRARHIGTEQWRNSSDLAGLQQYVAKLLESETDLSLRQQDTLGRDYEHLRACLPEK
ncbi:MAG: hypothetical protein ACE5LB_05375 [Acidiferrobacterales bacterium]